MSHLNAGLFSYLQLLLMCALCAAISAVATAAVGAARRSTLRHELHLARDGQIQANRLLHLLRPATGFRPNEQLTPIPPARHRRSPHAALTGPTLPLPIISPQRGSLERMR